MNVTVSSITGRTIWAAPWDVCPKCGRPFGELKQEKHTDGIIVHRNCWLAERLHTNMPKVVR